MRYILSALSLLLAVTFLLLGVGQRTIWAPPDTITEQLQDAVETPVLVVGGDVLSTHDGRQTITIEGDGEITAVVGRLTDVMGWVGDADNSVATMTDDGLALDVTTGGETEVPAIAGNDMWIQQQTGEGEVRFTVDAPYDYAIAIVSDGTAPAPSDVSVSWGYQSTTPLFGPLMTAGFVFLALALVLLLLALRRHRRQRGPQRRLSPAPSRRQRKEIQRNASQALADRPTPALTDPSIAEPDALEAGERDATTRPADEAGEASPDVTSTDETGTDETGTDETGTDVTSTDETGTDETHDDTHGDGSSGGAPAAGSSDAGGSDAGESPPGRPGRHERAARRFGVRGALRWLRLGAPVVVASVVLAGCSAGDWPSQETPTPTPTGTPEPTSIEDTLPPPAVTVRQFDRILADTREVVAEADEALDADLAAERLGGALLSSRETAYEVLGEDAEAMELTGIPDGQVSLVLPQQTEAWPRAVVAIVEWEDPELTPSALVFTQETPRDSYRVVYQMQLEPGATATGAAADIGAAGLPDTTPLLAVQPADVAADYADVLLHGSDSESSSLFDLEGEALNEQIGYAAKQERAGSEEFELVDLSWENAQDDYAPVTLVADADGGAYVATSFTETETLQPNEEGVTVSASGAAGILAGIDESEAGVSTTYQLQVLFYVPPSSAPEDEQQVTVIGYSQDLLSAQEVQ